jgi:hypothetical protein
VDRLVERRERRTRCDEGHWRGEREVRLNLYHGAILMRDGSNRNVWLVQWYIENRANHWIVHEVRVASRTVAKSPLSDKSK